MQNGGEAPTIVYIFVGLLILGMVLGIPITLLVLYIKTIRTQKFKNVSDEKYK